MIDVSDRQIIDDRLARYCWAFDQGDGEAYAALFTTDGVLRGFGEPMEGRETLTGLVKGTLLQTNGKWRHHLANLLVEYAGGKDTIEAKAYQLITNWNVAPPSLQMMAEAHWVFARMGNDWKIKSLDLQFVGPDA